MLTDTVESSGSLMLKCFVWFPAMEKKKWGTSVYSQQYLKKILIKKQQQDSPL